MYLIVYHINISTFSGTRLCIEYVKLDNKEYRKLAKAKGRKRNDVHTSRRLFGSQDRNDNDE